MSDEHDGCCSHCNGGNALPGCTDLAHIAGPDGEIGYLAWWRNRRCPACAEAERIAAWCDGRALDESDDPLKGEGGDGALRAYTLVADYARGRS
jgi:hypothetical protein